MVLCRLQTAADQSLARQHFERPQVYSPTTYNTGPVREQADQPDLHWFEGEDDFHHSTNGQERGEVVPKPMFHNLKRLAREGVYTCSGLRPSGIPAHPQAKLTSAGQVPELYELFRSEEILRATHCFNIALQSLAHKHVPRFYQTIIDDLGVQPDAVSVAYLIRALGKLSRLSQAEVIWTDWLVRFVSSSHTAVASNAMRAWHSGIRCTG